jgi:lipoprotein
MEDIMERLTDGKHYLLKIGAVLGVVATALGGCVINTAPEGR